jgi:hypothetical protein
MNASTILSRLKEAGVQVAVTDGQLKLKGPKTALNEEVLSVLRDIKAELIKLLSASEPETKPNSEAILGEWRAAIEAVYCDLPDFVKLKRESLRFLASPDAIAAVENAWDAVSLFGIHEGGSPKERIDCWGLVLFMAWGVDGCTVETIGQKVCALRTRSGAVQTQPRLKANFHEALVWWRHPGITNKDYSDE